MHTLSCSGSFVGLLLIIALGISALFLVYLAWASGEDRRQHQCLTAHLDIMRQHYNKLYKERDAEGDK